MPDLVPLALRYLLWLLGLRLAYNALIAMAGVPSSPATFVILAAAPAADIGVQMARRATRPLALADWAKPWAAMTGIYLVINLVIPYVANPQFRAALADPALLQTTTVIVLSVAFLLALFLWIGERIAGGAPRL